MAQAQLEKCLIKAVDPQGGEVKAKFNPSELSIDRSMSWEPKENKAGEIHFSKAEPRSLSVELLFDTYEERKSVYDLYIKPLEALTDVVEVDNERRPPICMFVWGNKFPSFTGAITSLSVKYTMFLHDGTPCRATCSLQMMHAPKTGEQSSRSSSSSSTAPRTVGQQDSLRADRGGPNHRETLAQSGSDDGRLTPGEPFRPDGSPNPDYPM